MQQPIYLDHNATTPVDPRVVEAMVEALRSKFGNAASRHEIGATAEAAVQSARRAVAKLIGAAPEDLFFTSGATESNNAVILGTARRRADRDVVLTSQVEHPSVLEPVNDLRAIDIDVGTVEVNGEGIVTPSAVAQLANDRTFLISIILANNEIGTVNPVKEYAPIARDIGALLHTDATQAVGHIPVSVSELGVDLMSFSAHKLYGPKGVGALYAARSGRRRMQPTALGGGHEGGVRSGTLNVPGIVGFGVAAEIAHAEMVRRERRVRELRDLLLALLQDGVPDLNINGTMDTRLPGNLSVAFPGIDAEALLVRLRDVVACSTGAACSSAKVEPSHVIMALTKDDSRAYSSVRFGVGKENTEEEIRLVAEAVTREVTVLRRMSSLGA